MKIAGLADERGRRVLEARAAEAGLQIAWVDSVEALSGHTDAIAYFDLLFEMNDSRIGHLRQLLPKPVIIHSVVHSLRQIGQPFIRINAWPGFLERRVCEIAVQRNDEEKTVAIVLEKLNWPYLATADIPGMISARIVASIINEAYYTLQDGVTTRESIDTAMKLGTNYPYGPFEWASLIGLQPIYALLVAMEASDPCYRASDLLRKEAADENCREPTKNCLEPTENVQRRDDRD